LVVQKKKTPKMSTVGENDGASRGKNNEDALICTPEPVAWDAKTAKKKKRPTRTRKKTRKGAQQFVLKDNILETQSLASQLGEAGPWRKRTGEDSPKRFLVELPTGPTGPALSMPNDVKREVRNKKTKALGEALHSQSWRKVRRASPRISWAKERGRGSGERQYGAREKGKTAKKKAFNAEGGLFDHESN